MTFTGENSTFQTDPSLTYLSYATTGANTINIPAIPGTTAITSLSGLSGPTITLSGGTTGYDFVPGGTTITLGLVSGATVRSSIGAAASGANSDITSLTALTLAVISTLRWLGFVSAANDPTTTELPTAKDVAIYKNTLSGNVFLAYNDSGSVLKVQLT